MSEGANVKVGVTEEKINHEFLQKKHTFGNLTPLSVSKRLNRGVCSGQVVRSYLTFSFLGFKWG